MFESAIGEIKKYNRIIIHRHTNPDGDAIGSQVGMKELLKKNFPEKEVYAVGDPAGRYAFIKGSTPDVIPDEYYDGALAIVLDTSAKALISDGRYATAERILRMDHHIFCEEIADIDIDEPSFESCCGLVAAFAKECKLELTSVAANALYSGMVTDSGRFRYDSTNARTFTLASFLMETGYIDTAYLFRNLYSDDLSAAKLRASFVLKIKQTEKGTAYIYTTKDELASTGADIFTVSRGMVGTMADLKGVDVWANFTETDSGVLCELRSSKYNINPIAVAHGGGGHAKASGATLRDKAEAMQVLTELDKLTEESV